MSRNQKLLLIVFTSLAGVVILLTIAGELLRFKIEKELATVDFGNYDVSYRKARVNLPGRAITLWDVRVRNKPRRDLPDTSAHLPVQYLNAKIDKLKVGGIGIAALRKGEVELGSLYMDSPNVTMVVDAGEKAQTPPSADTSGAKPASILDKLKLISIDKIAITGGALVYQTDKAADTLILEVGGLDLRADGFNISLPDQPHNENSRAESRGKPFFSDALAVNADGIRYTFNNAAYILAVDSLALDTRSGSGSLDAVKITPQYPKEEFVHRSARHSDWTEFAAEHLHCFNVDFDRLWNEGVVGIDSLYFPTGHIASFKDRRAGYPARVKPMIYKTIQDIPLKLEVRRIKTGDFAAIYEEQGVHSGASGVPGRVTFEHIDALIEGFTNVARRREQLITITASARLMGQAALDATFHLPADPQNDYFEVAAHMGPMKLSALDPIITPLANAEIKSGNVEGLDYRIGGSSHRAKAQMTLLYNNLEIGLMKDTGHGLKERTGLSDMVNLLAIRSENPNKHGQTHKAEVEVERDPHRSMWNYLWRGVLEGAKQTAETDFAHIFVN